MWKTPELTREETHDWMGGEAVVGAQAERHVRAKAANVRALAATILGLTFLGGLTLAGAICSLCASLGARRRSGSGAA